MHALAAPYALVSSESLDAARILAALDAARVEALPHVPLNQPARALELRTGSVTGGRAVM
jgi:hypothetical protein